MKTLYSYNEMERAFECGRNFQLTGENNFKELIDEISKLVEKEEKLCRKNSNFVCNCIDNNMCPNFT